MTKQELVKKAMEGWTEDQFIKQQYAVDKKGHAVDDTSPKAVKWCAYGRLMRANELNLSLPSWIGDDFRTKYGASIVTTNDRYGFTVVKEKLEHLYD